MCLGSILDVQMYFIIKSNVFYKYIINAITTAINTCKKSFDFDQREVISFFMLVTKSTLLFTQSKQTLTQ